MPTTSGDVQLYYETRGDSDGVPLLLIQGFTWQMVGWHEGFLQKLVDRGAYVILYDNRDVGLSQKFGGPQDYDGGYALSDMADDGFAVLDALGLESAHIAGASMGGMIAQTMAAAHPSRVRSLNLIYTAPSLDARYIVPQGSQDPLDMMKQLDRDTEIAEFIEKERISSSTVYPFDEVRARELGALMYDRCYAPTGRLRQAIAISRWAPPGEALAKLEMPTSIIHGRADLRIRVEAAFDLGQLLPHSELHVFPGLGHEIAPALWDEFANVVMRTAARA